MNIATYFINNRVISWLFITLLFFGGYFSFQSLPRLEDPEFTIKVAMVITQYPGASAEQVEEEVTAKLENAIQQLQAVERVTSISSAGLSQVVVKIYKEYGPNELPQVWDELRRKVSDISPSFPPSVRAPTVNDDFGDVFGQLITVYGDGYSYQELSDYADYLRRELVIVDGVGKVSIAGERQEQVFIEFSLAKLHQLGISLNRIETLLAEQNKVSDAGSLKMQGRTIRIQSTGEFQRLADLENLLISEASSQSLIYLKDVATVKRAAIETPTNLYAHNGRRAIALGVSFASGTNVVDVGLRVTDRLKELEYARPYGIETALVYNQPEQVVEAVDDFIYNLIAAIIIVFIVLAIFMGLRTGIVIGIVLLLTVLGTFIFMKAQGIELQRISLGALVIALGMLVDNAIVIVEGILTGIKKGLTKAEAATVVVKQTKLPLLGATVIGILAFAPIGLSPDATGEIVGSLFYVLLYSLLLSWVTAITLTPFLANILLKDDVIDIDENKNDISSTELTKKAASKKAINTGTIYRIYASSLKTFLHHKKLSLFGVLIVLSVSFYSAKNIKIEFFPPMTTPLFLVDYWLPYGSDIEEVYQDVTRIDEQLRELPGIKQITSTSGQGAMRFMLSYRSERIFPNYGQLIVRAEHQDLLPELMTKTNQLISEHYPDAFFQIKRLEIGAQPEGEIEARINGSDPKVLRQIAEQVKDIYRTEKITSGIRDDWREPTMFIRPEFDHAKAQRLGISKADVDNTLLMAFSGSTIGLYRESTKLLPIVMRLPLAERHNIKTLESLPIWSPVSQGYIPIEQVLNGFNVEFEDPIINRRDRKRTITAMTNIDVMATETVAELQSKVKERIDNLSLPKGYTLEWGGIYENSNLALASLGKIIPFGFLLMFIITILLFNSLIQPIILWLVLPFSFIGVVIGLLLTGKPLTFMAILGILSLTGMLLKNGIVLMEQIKHELSLGKQQYLAVVDSAISRARPVLMAAITTIIGMFPLVTDPFYASMAITIMGGLGVGTLLTLYVVPLLYVVFYNVKSAKA